MKTKSFAKEKRRGFVAVEAAILLTYIGFSIAATVDSARVDFRQTFQESAGISAFSAGQPKPAAASVYRGPDHVRRGKLNRAKLPDKASRRATVPDESWQRRAMIMGLATVPFAEMFGLMAVGLVLQRRRGDSEVNEKQACEKPARRISSALSAIQINCMSAQSDASACRDFAPTHGIDGAPEPFQPANADCKLPILVGCDSIALPNIVT
jgi:hypothetical protein